MSFRGGGAAMGHNGGMPTLETDRLIVRPFRREDWTGLCEYVWREEVSRYDHEYPKTEEGIQEVSRFFAESDGFWAVCLKEEGRLIGHVVCGRKDPQEFLTWHIGFVFNPDFQGKGLATEACRAVVEHVFTDLGGRRIESTCDPRNRASWRLLERLGMRREAHHVKIGFMKRTPEGEPIWGDCYEYAILREEWR